MTTRSLRPEDLYAAPNAIAEHYSRFRVSERLLLTGHSHQAWPDRARAGLVAAFDDAAEHVDDKWERAFARAERVRQGYRRLVGDPSGEYTLAASTHEVLVKFLSALPLRERPRVVTTDAEFHSARRQLDRLAEEGLEVVRVSAEPASDVGERLAAAVDDRTACALLSTVFYDSARIAGGLEAAMAGCERHGARLLLDLYHQLNVVPFSLEESGLEAAYAVGGGYKYCQLGEGNAFLRSPPGCELRPVITGWFAEFEELSESVETVGEDEPKVGYGAGPWRFAGGTFDPASHYRGAAVLDFFDDLGLEVELLREVSRHQVGLLAALFDKLDLRPETIDRDRDTPLERIGGFLALSSPHAGEIQSELRRRGVFSDARGDVLRLGPAPYLADTQIADAMLALGEIVRELE